MHRKLEIIEQKDFDSFFDLLDKSFPNIERRSRKGQKEIFSEILYKVYGIKNGNDKVLGFIATWEFDKFNFIEHFAVDISLRGNGLGTKMLKEYIKNFNKPIYLEVEYPNDAISIRRIEFYKRLGFYLNDFEYVQLPLQVGNELLPLKIMTYPYNISENEFIYFRNNVYDKVYKQNNNIFSF
ncbi:GNAT family N-acetyltransferase [Clostridium taeniosporum]|uniref:N-acetyltransferase n=1 Tax=Clostridium taeniosporum TaxID=394958 RepID=A0A1D7XKM4_9CLOT|nr:GNAT family N-acetyltransferase [Clostridium taeniosporum]AOR23847.1 N-acetyltransferase [Clostridium taeniosporum]